MDIKTALASARRPEKVVPICLRGDLLGEFDAAESELQQLEKTVLSAPSLAAGGRRRQIAERLDALRQQMLDESVPFRLRGLGRAAWTQLMSEHPPRDDAERAMGMNGGTFFPALVRASVVEPEISSEEWDTLLADVLTSAQFEALADAAWAVNRSGVDVPFSRAALRIQSTSEPE